MSVRLSSSVPITVVIIARNEERRIGDCIDSVGSLTSDIVVIDSGSTDRTKEIAEEKGARVVCHAWEGYSEQKNFGNSLAKNDWILSLDADERVSIKLADSIRREFASGPSCDAYTFRFKNFFEGKPVRFGAWNPDSHTRLFDRRKFSWNRDAVHEGLCGDADCRVGGLEGVVLHFTVESRHQFAAKTELYTSIFAEKIRLGQNRISWRKVWLNPVWRFCRDYILRLGVLDGLAGWRIACEGMRYTYLKYSKMAEATGGYRSPNWRGLTVVASAVVLGGLALKSYAIDHRSMLTQVTHKHESAARSGNVQLASLDDNYEDGDAVFPVDDDGVA